ncbi:hypothetical protein GCM10022281_22970 [Sphingomonas rosea]|uniref:Protein kinase domain-containing protein n=1 Tax=Sphingomonas rosea TaxID=335605 RepID=A0ABP7UEB4_9SPHN
MNKAYSTKALPAGTVLREWRLEEVLGVGGFGIVYKGRGIYFNELVAIKEYFPSSISERDAEATVVPIDSDAEEVHALGLKKFVEEAKLLWNLSTPSRHPNIVSVRSLFEIHGTAYMVMDFEDGMSLSRLIKQGQKWNERSLLAIIRPVAEGLDRAHRVGVLHRDIKPPNILINDSGKPVLIDFGSARFEAAEATSTKVTFHTPPYAAIEQYVKTFEQGPWTDIYALGVVLYECVTGTKPPEVLERMHGGAGEALADRHWPGYSPRFLAAVDAAMAVKPADRPQSIAAWLKMLDETGGAADEEAEDVTQVVPFMTASETIVPVAPVDRESAGVALDTGVPAHPSQAEFKRAGHTKAGKKTATAEAPPSVVPKPDPTPPKPEHVDARKADLPPAPPPSTPAKADAAPKDKKPLLIGGAVAALLVVGAGYAFTQRSAAPGPSEGPIEVLNTPAPDTSAPATLAELTTAATDLARDAEAARLPEAAMAPLSALTAALSASPAPADAAAAAQARTAATGLAAALVQSVDERTNALSRQAPWSNADAATLPADRQQPVTALRTSLGDLRGSAGRVRAATDPRVALAEAHKLVATYGAFGAAATAVADIQGAEDRRLAQQDEAKRREEQERLRKEARATAAAVPASRPVATAAAPVVAAPAASATLLSPATTSEFNAIVNDARGMAKQVIRMGSRARPGSTPEERANYDMLRANAQLAQTYDASLANLKNAFRGVRSDQQAQSMVKQAKQTRAYLVFLVKRSSGAKGR